MTLIPCACGATPIITENPPPASEWSRFKVVCPNRIRYKHYAGCHASAPQYGRTLAKAVGAWNGQFGDTASDRVTMTGDRSKFCRCGLRLPCNGCLSLDEIASSRMDSVPQTVRIR